MQQVYKTLPDDKPITAICVIEDPSKCPPGFCIISRTHDQDSDADLWREYSFFGRRICRYLCISKTQGIADYIVENVKVIGDKDMPPDGYCPIPRTVDGDSKAWKKRQLCYSLTRRNLAAVAVTDIILLNKSKRAPEGFFQAGDVNGLLLCYKTSNNFNLQTNNGPPTLAYGLNQTNPVENKATPPPASAALNRPMSNGGVYPLLGRASNSSPSSDEYVNLIRPTRPAPPTPQKPTQSSPGSYATMSGYQGLEGIPFVLNPNLKYGNSSNLLAGIPVIKARTKEELDKEYYYDFRLERQT